MTSSGSGNILGTYYAYLRFVDKDGNFSNVSPISPSHTTISSTGTVTSTPRSITNAFSAPEQSITIDGDPAIIRAGTTNVTVASHGLTVRTTQYVNIVNVVGTSEINGTFEVVALDTNTINVPVRFVNTYVSGGTLQSIGNGITAASNATPIVITSAGHSLTTGQLVRITGVTGNTDANGVWSVTVLTSSTFSLNDSAGNATYTGGGVWITGAGTMTYSNLEAPTDPKVTRRQICRNTNAQTQTFYVDIDTQDLASSSLSSATDDDALQYNESVPILDSLGRDLAIARYTPPPDHKPIIAHHGGRMFACGTVVYSQGNVQVTFGSKTVTGTGTEFVNALADRYLHVTGGDQPYLISSVSVSAQTLTLDTAYTGSTDLFALYAIKPAPAERRLLSWTESGLEDAWPPSNAIQVKEDNDDFTGLMSQGSFLYILENRNIYRFTFQSDPALDGFPFKSISRGCVNQRCWIQAEDVTYMLDEAGIHAFSGGEMSEPVSATIQDLFRPSDSEFRVNWNASKWFHAGHFPSQETIRFFVSMEGQDDLPKHAICFNYRAKRWSIDQFPVGIGASCSWPTSVSSSRSLLGSDAKKVWALWNQGVTLDGPDAGAGTVRGTATSSSITSLTDSAATFPSTGVVLAPLTIVSGTGKGQTRIIYSVSSTTLNITQPWLILPDTTSVYQIGGVNWRYQTGWFRFSDDEFTQTRRVEAIFQPTVGACTTDMHIYVDFGTTPINSGVTYKSSDLNGLGLTQNSPHLVMDMTKTTGFIQTRLDSHKELYSDGWRFMSVELAGVSNADPIQIFGLKIDGVN